MNLRFFILLYCCLSFVNLLSAQEDIPVKQLEIRDSLTMDSTGVDTLGSLLDQIVISPNAIDRKVIFGAQDSQIIDNAAGKVFLYGNAFADYDNLSLQADYIELSLDSSIAYASGMKDSLGEIAGSPVLKDGDQSFEAKRMRYNFKSQKGIVYDVVTQEGDVFVHGAKTKFVNTQIDSATNEDHIYNEDALFTTCDHDEPHFGIRSKKQKLIPNKLVVVGPANLEINKVPTPLWLPFGFFPIAKGQRNGLIFPRDYEYSDNWGFGLKNIGYYFPINENIDLTLTGDVYVKGSWGIQMASNYVKRYRYRGGVNLAFSSRRSEIPNDYRKRVDNSYSIRINHSQDAKAHPYRSVSASINLQGNGFNDLNRVDADNVLSNELSSNASYRYNFPGKPYAISANMSHSQNQNTRKVRLTLPTVDFTLNRIYPFRKKGKPSSSETWYDKISFQYSANAKNLINATDTTLFKPETFRNMQNGVRHKANTNASFRILKYFNVSPAINYEEYWYFKTLEKQFAFDPLEDIEIDTIWNLDMTDYQLENDTISYGEVIDNFNTGFDSWRKFDASISVNTQRFKTLNFKNGPIRGLRHVVKPTVSFAYAPDQSRLFTKVQSDIREYVDSLSYTRFDGGIYSRPQNSRERLGITYSINNIVEAKFYNKKDSTERKVKLFDNVYVGGNYNFIADSLKWSDVSIRGNWRIFKGMTTINYNLNLDPYALNEDGNVIDEFYWNESRRPFRFESGNLAATTSLTVRKIKELLNLDKQESGSSQGRKQGTDLSMWDYFDRFSISHNLALRRSTINGQDTTFLSTHSINGRGSLDLTDKWGITVGNIGYDFINKSITYPSLGFTRDLHCWELSFNWQPFRNTYSMFIGVKPGTLDFIRIPYQQNNQDGFRGF